MLSSNHQYLAFDLAASTSIFKSCFENDCKTEYRLQTYSCQVTILSTDHVPIICRKSQSTLHSFGFQTGTNSQQYIWSSRYIQIIWYISQCCYLSVDAWKSSAYQCLVLALLSSLQRLGYQRKLYWRTGVLYRRLVSYDTLQKYIFALFSQACEMHWAVCLVLCRDFNRVTSEDRLCWYGWEMEDGGLDSQFRHRCKCWDVQVRHGLADRGAWISLYLHWLVPILPCCRQTVLGSKHDSDLYRHTAPIPLQKTQLSEVSSQRLQCIWECKSAKNDRSCSQRLWWSMRKERSSHIFLAYLSGQSATNSNCSYHNQEVEEHKTML